MARGKDKVLSNVIPQPGDFACVPVPGEGGVLIRLGEKLNGSAFSQYQHAEIYVGTSDQLAAQYQYTAVARKAQAIPAPFGWTFGAYPGGARLVPLPCPPAELPGALWSSGVIPLTDTERHDIVGAALVLRGVPYGFIDYLALALHHFHVNDPALQRFIKSSKSLICSQLVSHVYTEAGVNLFTDGRWEGDVTPADLAQLIHSKEPAPS